MLSETIASTVDTHREVLIDLSHRIHGWKETAYEEFQSAEATASVLRDNGFTVKNDYEDLPTAFRATYGSGSLNVGICAEYDALPGIGHACGHNIIAAAAVGAGLALAAVADELDLTVTVLGTPAEEGGGGKVRMLQVGAFDGLNLAMMVHPYAAERDAMGSLAVSQLDVEFKGRPAHAAAHPEDGISASAALALAQSGVAFLREHFYETDRVHGIVIFGGDAPNIVPERTKGRWFVRSLSQQRLLELQPKIENVFRGAALMTGCEVEIKKMSPSYSEIRSDARLTEVWRTVASELGRTSVPLGPGDAKASTDMGNVSYALPTIHPLIAIEANGANIHQAAFAEAAISRSGDEAVVYGAKAMAMTVLQISQDTDLKAALVANRYAVSEEADRAYLDEEWQELI